MSPLPRDPHLELLDDARQAEAVADRSRRRLLTEADDQDATFAGTIRGAAESGATVVLHTVVDRRLRGRVTAIGAEHLVLTGEHGTAWVRLDAVTTLRTGPDVRLRAAGGDRTPHAAAPLDDVLVGLRDDRATVDAHLVGGAVVRGTLVAVGADVLTVRNPASAELVLVHLPLVAVLTHTTG